MKNNKSPKSSIVKSVINTNTEPSEVIKDQTDIIVWSFNTKRNKKEISIDCVDLMKKFNKNNSKDLDLIKKMINLHNEYRFPLVQLRDTNKKSIEIARQFLIFITKIS